MRDSDLPFLAEWNMDPRVGVPHWGRTGLRSETALRQAFAGWGANDDPSRVGFCIETRASAELVGAVAIGEMVGNERNASMGIFLAPDAVGHGYGPDAVGVILRYAFDELGLHRLQLKAFASNTRAIAAYRKVGFLLEGQLRQVSRIGGQWEDEVVMSVLEPEWRSSGHHFDE